MALSGPAYTAPMLIAQALGEYGAGMVVSQALEGFANLVDRVRHASPSTLALVGFGAFAVWFIVGRRR